MLDVSRIWVKRSTHLEVINKHLFTVTHKDTCIDLRSECSHSWVSASRVMYLTRGPVIHTSLVGFTGFQLEANMEFVELVPTTFFHSEVGESSLVRDDDVAKFHGLETSKLGGAKNCFDNFINRHVFGATKCFFIYHSGVPLMNVYLKKRHS